MAALFDAAGVLGGVSGGNVLTVTLSVTIGASANGLAGILVVSAASTPATVNVTWNGVNFTSGGNGGLIGSRALATGQVLYAFGVIGSTVTGNTGTHNLVATITGPASVTDMYLNGISFTGVDQGSFSNAFSNFTSAGASTANASIAITSNAANTVVAAFYNEAGASQFTNGTSSPNASTEWFAQAGLSSNAESIRAIGAATQTMHVVQTAEAWVAIGFDVNSIAAASAVEGYTSQIFRPKRSLWR